jgi:hypothetical protein
MFVPVDESVEARMGPDIWDVVDSYTRIYLMYQRATLLQGPCERRHLEPASVPIVYYVWPVLHG